MDLGKSDLLGFVVNTGNGLCTDMDHMDIRYLRPDVLDNRSCWSPLNRYQCHFCSYRSNRRHNAQRHYRTMHAGQSGVPLECCGLLFNDKAQLRDHKAQLHSVGYVCPICGVIFQRRSQLVRHDVVHSGHRQFACSQCPYASSSKSNIDRHCHKVHGFRTACRTGSTSTMQVLASHWSTAIEKTDSPASPGPSDTSLDSVQWSLGSESSSTQDEYQHYRPKRLCSPGFRQMSPLPPSDVMNAAMALLFLKHAD